MFGTCTFARYAISYFCEEAFNVMLCTSLLFKVKWPAFATVPAKKKCPTKDLLHPRTANHDWTVEQTHNRSGACPMTELESATPINARQACQHPP